MLKTTDAIKNRENPGLNPWIGEDASDWKNGAFAENVIAVSVCSVVNELLWCGLCFSTLFHENMHDSLGNHGVVRLLGCG